MTRTLDIATWNRRHHFEFFKYAEEPFFNLCTEVDVTELYDATLSSTKGSFFLASLWFSLKAANETLPFRYRMDGDAVRVFDRVDAGSTILRDDQTFGFGYFEYEPEFELFAGKGLEEIDRVRARTGDLGEQTNRLDRIYYSVIPWVSFSSFSHARNRNERDSIPRIVFGKHHQSDGARKLPISVEVHHALVDGLDVAQFLERLQGHLDDPALLNPLG